MSKKVLEDVGSRNPTTKEILESAATKRYDLDEVIGDAMQQAINPMVVVRKVHDKVVIDSGRRYSDGEPVLVWVWLPAYSNTLVGVGDGCLTFVRLADQTKAPDYAMSVRAELLEHLPVRDAGGQIMMTTHIANTAEAISTLADSCVALDVAVIVANHLRPKTSIS